MSHSPAPWKTGEVIGNVPSTRVDSAEGDPVAWVYEEGDEALVVAAPEMLQLLEDILKPGKYVSTGRVMAVVAQAKGELKVP